MSMDQFKTRAKAQTPTRVHLVDPATGELTDHWVEIHSSLSDVFLAAREAAMQEVSLIASPVPAERKAQTAEIQLRMKSALLAGWSFEEEATEEAKMEFLREAPQVQLMVMSVADDHARFFGSASSDS